MKALVYLGPAKKAQICIFSRVTFPRVSRDAFWVMKAQGSSIRRGLLSRHSTRLRLRNATSGDLHGSVIDIVFPSAALLVTEITPLGEALTQ